MMAIRDGLLPEFDHEVANTRKTLERVPEGKPDYKPHEKSMAMGRLAGHLAELPGWAKEVILRDSLEVRRGDPNNVPLVMTSRKQLLEEFDKRTAASRAAIAAASDEELMKPWSLIGTRPVNTDHVSSAFRWAVNHLSGSSSSRR
ncbi:MAG: DinB family protein [Candidatus Acidiferrales bacterium]